jgi:hypothetical protein
MNQEQAGTDYWYQTERRAGTRLLSDSERQHLLTERIWFRIISVFLALILPFLFFGFLAVGAFFLEPTNSDSGLHIVILLGGIVLSALTVMGLKFFNPNSTALKKDLEKGFVNQYRLNGIAWEILPVSNRILTMDDTFQTWFRAPFSQNEYAVAPDSTVPTIEESTPNHVEPTLLETERSLTEAERTELKKLARNVWLPRLPFPLFLNLWFWPFFIALARNNALDQLPFQLLAVGISGIACTGWAIAGFSLSRKLLKDMDSGRVERTIQNGSLKEYLPFSQQPWTTDGTPAPWRGNPDDVAPQR